MDLRNFKATVIPRGFVIVFMIWATLMLLITFVKDLAVANSRNTRISMEWAYFEGQKEALNGDMRISYNPITQKYSWKKSCWDEGLTPIFNPSVSENRREFLNK